MMATSHPPCVRYVAAPESSADDAARQSPLPVHRLSRRGVTLGWISGERHMAQPDAGQVAQRWRRQQPVWLPALAADRVGEVDHELAATEALVAAVLEGDDPEALLDARPYVQRLAGRFALLGSVCDEGDPQEIVTLEFDALDTQGEVAAEGLWCKLSWLSFEEDDASLRFRFSFGLDHYEDVAADFPRQQWSAALAETLFPESRLISADASLDALFAQALGVTRPAYVERIVYFNAPDGGAQFHHDVERGHLGVVYLQVSGRTAWLALSKAELVGEIEAFMAGDGADALAAGDRRAIAARLDDLAAWLDDEDNEPLEQLINRTPAFARQLMEAGHGYILEPGDVLLLPQGDLENCAWHSVFCLGEEMGEALSFALRESAP